MKYEVRFTPSEVRMMDGGKMFSGMAARFYNAGDEQGTTFRLSSTCTERIARSAFERTINDGHDVKIYGQHNPDEPLGRTNTDKLCKLRLWTDDKGLRFSLPYDKSDPDHRKYRAKIRNGSVPHMSFRFFAEPGKGDKLIHSGGRDYRELVDIDVDEISFVTNGAYTGTGGMFRSEDLVEDFAHRFDAWKQTEARFEKARILLGPNYIEEQQPKC